jgi:hypothetical protein
MEHATLALQAVSIAIETPKEGLMSKDALTDLKLFIGTQFADTRSDFRTRIADIRTDIKNLRFVILATWSVSIAAIGLMAKYLLP